MRLISHRGNIGGRIIEEENNPEYVMDTLSIGYDVEIDVWFIDNVFYLGHDEPQYQIHSDFLKNENLWCHSKNIESLERMLTMGVHCFFHNTDDCTLTSRGYIWTYPGKLLLKNSICVLPELSNYEKYDCFGICSDYIEKYK